MDAADRLFARFGYRRTSMDDIAGEAGVAKGTLYIYFPSKEVLFRAILARHVEVAARLCDAAEAKGGDLETQLLGQFEAWFGATADKYGTSGNLLELSDLRSTLGQDVVTAADRAYEARLVRIVEAAQADGRASLSASGLDATQLVAVLLAAARGAKYSRGIAVAPEAFRLSLQHIARLAAAVSLPPKKRTAFPAAP